MIVLPTLEMFSRFTSMDGYILSGWLLSCGWLMRGAANRERRVVDAQRARLIALCFLLAGLAALAVAEWVAPEGGLTIYGGVTGLAWMLGLISIWWFRRTGRPLL